MRFRAAGECGEAPALAAAARANLSGSLAGEHDRGGCALQLQPGRDPLQLSAGDGAARPNPPGRIDAAHAAWRVPPLWTMDPRAAPQADPARAAAGPPEAVRDVLPDCGRHRPLRPQQRHPVSGARFRRQFNGLLLPAHHGGAAGDDQPVVRALHQRRAQRASGHRRRF